MSVAFRRESDDEHKEPRFEHPIPPGPNLVTPRGLHQIEAKVAELETALADAPESKDDPEIEDRRRDLRYWRQRLATAQLVETPPADEVGFGSKVVFKLNGKKRTITIVGDDESEPTEGLLAISAPLAQALVGGGEGDILPFADKADAIEIVSIR